MQSTAHRHKNAKDVFNFLNLHVCGESCEKILDGWLYKGFVGKLTQQEHIDMGKQDRLNIEAFTARNPVIVPAYSSGMDHFYDYDSVV